MNIEEAIKLSVKEAYRDMRRELREDMEDNVIPVRDFKHYALFASTRAVQYFIDKVYGDEK